MLLYIILADVHTIEHGLGSYLGLNGVSMRLDDKKLATPLHVVTQPKKFPKEGSLPSFMMLKP